MKKLLIVLTLLSLSAIAFEEKGRSRRELDSYCEGYCKSRYDTGYYENGKCACIEYEPISEGRMLKIPSLPKPLSNDEY